MTRIHSRSYADTSPAAAHTPTPGDRRPLARFLHAVVNLYALAMIVYLPLRLLTGDSLWWLAAINNFTPFLFLPALPLTLIALLMRSPLLLVRTLPFVLIGLLWFGPRFLPKPVAAAPPNAPHIEVLSFNIHYSNPDPALALDWVREQNAEIVLLQEVTPTVRDELLADLDDLYEILPGPWIDVQNWGSATLIRGVVLESEQIMLVDRPALRTVVEIDGQRIAVYNIHNTIPQMRLYGPDGSLRPLEAVRLYDPTRRDLQNAALLERLEDETLPYIVGGDFNTSDQSAMYQTLVSHMNDAFATAGTGLGLSWPARRFAFLPAMIRIDYVWHSAHFRALDAEQGPYLKSDHIPLLASLALVGR